MAQQIVNSYTEWDPLEEVVVGRLAGDVFPTWQPSMRAVLPEDSVRLFQERGGSPYPPEQVLAAKRELDGLVDALEAEGITVVRPAPIDHSLAFSTRCISLGFRHVYTFGGSFHCVTIDVRRRGELRHFLN